MESTSISKLPVMETLSQGWRILKTDFWRLLLYVFLAEIALLIPMMIAAFFMYDTIISAITAGISWSFYPDKFVLPLIIGGLFSSIFYIALLKIVRDIYYKQKASFRTYVAFGWSKMPISILFFMVIISCILILAFTLFMAIAGLGYINETLGVTVGIIIGFGSLFPLAAAYLAVIFAYYTVIFHSKKFLNAIADGFYVIFKCGNFWRTVALSLVLLMLLIPVIIFDELSQGGLNIFTFLSLLYGIFCTMFMYIVSVVAYEKTYAHAAVSATE